MHWFTFATFIIVTLTSYKSQKLNKVDESYRLPKNIQPRQYFLTIEPNFGDNPEESSFHGSVSIELQVLGNTNNITIHARNLIINKGAIGLIHKNGSTVKITETTEDSMRHFYIIHLENEIFENENYTLTIGEFSGALGFDNVGFYLAKYNDPHGSEKILAITDFQPAGARKAFPCFDEPALKAKFTVNIIRSNNYSSASNEKLVVTENLGNGRFRDKFEETPMMSTYLVAFAVFEYSPTVQNGKFRIFAKPEAINAGRVNYVLSFSESLLERLENFTGINYSLSKLDLLAVPHEYFEPGGMENWGLITYSEPNIFCSNTTTDLQNCFIFTAHELAHQWFGDLVTPSWWKYLWLSEGFATYLQYYIPSLMNPAWKLMEQFLIMVQQKVLTYDGNTINQPLNQEPQHPGGFPSLLVAYYKGACIIRMIRHFLTKDIFESGIRAYLQKHQFETVEVSDLYHAFQQAVDEADAKELLGNLNVSSILHTWDSTKGYPLVTASRNYQNGSVTFSQGKFFPLGMFEFSRVWYIPINYVFQSDFEKNFSNTVADVWFTKKRITINNLPISGWMLVNKLQTGYYRVNYDTSNWNYLSEFLHSKNYTEIPTLNRAQLLDDAFALAWWHHISYETALNLSKYIIQEKEYVPLTTFLNSIESLLTMMSASADHELFKNYLMNLLSGAYSYLGVKEKSEDEHLDRLNRINILTWMCNLGHAECRKTGLAQLREWAVNNRPTSPDLTIPLLCGALQIGSEDDWNILYAKCMASKDPDQNYRIFISLACSKSESVLQRYLDIIFNMNNTLSLRVRQMGFAKLVQSTDNGFRVAFDYMINNYSEKNEIFKKIKVAEQVGKRITTTTHLEKLRELLDSSSLDTSGIITTSVLYAQRNLNWINKGYINDISKWLKRHEAILGNMD